MRKLLQFSVLAVMATLVFAGCSGDKPEEASGVLQPDVAAGAFQLPGDETLADIDIPLASGTGIAIGGVGLVGAPATAQPGEINIDVPGNVQQVLLYWTGHNEVDGTDTEVTVNGVSVTGTLIGGPTRFFNRAWSSTVRADITDMGVVATGANVVVIGGMDFTTSCPDECQNLGAGLLVIYDDGSDAAQIAVKDGNDNAFFSFAPPLDTTVPQTFNFASASSDRVAQLCLFAGSVAQFPATGRPNVVEVTIDAVVTRFVDVFQGNSGDDFDAVSLDVPIPAGASSMTVQALSEADPSSELSGQPASFNWLTAALSVPPGDTPPLGSIGDYVWCDLNNDGVQDDNEPGIADVTVNLVCTLADSSTLTLSTTTDADGGYLFSGLPAGTCVVTVDTNSPSLGDKVPGDNCPVEFNVDLGEGEDFLDADFCFVYPPLGSIGDYVWCDLNNDGVQDANEPGIPDVTVNLVCTLEDNSTITETTTTDADGGYLFTGLPAGMCVVTVDPNSPSLGDKVPGDYCPVEHTVDLGEGEVFLDADFCFIYPEECDECDGKVTELTLQYNGSSAAMIKVVQKKPEVVVFMDMVNPGETFSFSGQDDKGTLSTEIKIYVDGVENTKIHTSCSQPIGPGLISGDFEVISGYSRNGGLLCPLDPPPGGGDCGECKGKVTELTMQYNGSSAAMIKVVQKKPEVVVFMDMVNPGETFSFSGQDDKGTLSTEIKIYVDGVENTKIHTSCSQPIGPGLVSGDFEVISGRSREGGELCPVDLPPPGEDDCECDGKVTSLKLQYNGGVTNANIVVESKEGVVFDGTVQPGEMFSFVGNDKHGTLGTEIKVFVNGDENTKIHTSCSRPIGPGLVSDDFLVVEGASRNNGPLCPLN